MSIFREHDFLKPEEVTIDKIFEICQNAYMDAKISDNGDTVVIREDNISIYVHKNHDGVRLVDWTSFGIVENAKNEESLSMAKETCYYINNYWRMLRSNPNIFDGLLVIESSYEIYCDRGLFIPQLVSDIKRFCSILNSVNKDSFYKLSEELGK